MTATTPATHPQRPCKIKRVYDRLPLHVHSADDERLTETNGGNPAQALRRRLRAQRPSEWSTERLRKRLARELSPGACARLNALAVRVGSGVEVPQECGLSGAL